MQPQLTKYQWLCESLVGILDEPRELWRSFPCLIWEFSLTPQGYGQVRADGKATRVHCISFEKAYGSAGRRRISHRCANNACYRPCHLFATDNRLEYLHEILNSLDDDLSRPWTDYPCLDWPFGQTNGGYGNLRSEGEGIRVHRYSYEFVHGPLPAELNACHHCDRPICHRPIHLFKGSHLDNNRDMRAKGRGWTPGERLDIRGELNPSAVLTWDQVREMRALYATTIPSQRKLAKMFGIAQPHVGAIVRNELWIEPVPESDILLP